MPYEGVFISDHELYSREHGKLRRRWTQEIQMVIVTMTTVKREMEKMRESTKDYRRMT